MNETELKIRLRDLGVVLTLDRNSERIQLAEEDDSKLTPDLRKSLNTLERSLVCSQLYRASFEYLERKLHRDHSTALDAVAVAAFNDEGRFETLSALWHEGTLEDFKRTLKSGIEASISSAENNHQTGTPLDQKPQPAEVAHRLPNQDFPANSVPVSAEQRHDSTEEPQHDPPYDPNQLSMQIT